MTREEASGGGLHGRLASRVAELEARIAAEQARPIPDQGALRRLRRERLLARDRMAAAAGTGMPPWARDVAPGTAA
ncbi:MAG TPA: DUF465 domain-containing protein [Acetobacteraceae bacterium]|jgi:hypothetical protein|nr:DUF465 domain-containing protein [Acetobacteraceae bacterium]